ncbi:MAG: hypothetical protein U0326_00080, partial [Polyangiales bacterium]
VVFLSPDDGIRDQHGQIMSAVNLAEDADELLAAPWLKDSMRKKLVEARAMLEHLPRSSSVAIASPENLTRELFTHKGAGTLVRLGERIRRYDTLDDIDRPRLRTLLEDSFGRALRDDYFDTRRFHRVYLADSYRATAILTMEPTTAGEVPYLDKFAVTSDAQGDGLGASLWQRFARETPRFFWRARPDNEVNPWYFARADGSARAGDWVVFWVGLDDFSVVAACVERAASLPASLAPPR